MKEKSRRKLIFNRILLNWPLGKDQGCSGNLAHNKPEKGVAMAPGNWGGRSRGQKESKIQVSDG